MNIRVPKNITFKSLFLFLCSITSIYIYNLTGLKFWLYRRLEEAERKANKHWADKVEKTQNELDRQ